MSTMLMCSNGHMDEATVPVVMILKLSAVSI